MSEAAKYPAITVHGPDVTEAATRRISEAIIDLLNTVGEHMGGSPIPWKVTDVLFRCDGCDLRQSFDADRTNWTYYEGDDYCPRCSAERM